MKYAWLIGLLLGGVSMTGDSKIQNGAQAIAAFQSAWKGTLSKQIHGHPGFTHMDRLVGERKPTTRQTTQGHFKSRWKEMIAYESWGSPKSPCWELFYDGLLTGGMVACVNAADGKVVAVVELPEG